MSRKAILILVSICAAFILLVVSLAIALMFLMVSSKVAQQSDTLKAKEAELEARMAAKGKVVYCLKDITAGSIIELKDVQEREVDQAKIPKDAIASTSLTTGRRAKYGMAKGQIISQHGLTPAKAGGQ